MQAEPQQQKLGKMHYASFKTRVYAFLLDYLVIAVYGVFVVGSISIIFKSMLTPLFSGSPVTAELTGFLLLTLPVSLYFILFESSKWQGTWGKKKMSIRVMDSAGKRIGLGRSTVRTAIKFLPWEVAHFGMWRLIRPTVFYEITILVILYLAMLTVLIYLLSPLTNKKRKTIYDWIAGTKVVS